MNETAGPFILCFVAVICCCTALLAKPPRVSEGGSGSRVF